jgi:septation ring formation regulator EzrA
MTIAEYKEKLANLESELSRMKSEKLTEINSLRERYLLKHTRFLNGQKVGIYLDSVFNRLATVNGSYIDNEYVIRYSLVKDHLKKGEVIQELDHFSNNG